MRMNKNGCGYRTREVTLDNRGRITIPQHVLDKLQLSERDILDLDLEDSEIRLRQPRPPFEPITSGKCEWGTKTFMSAGEALFGGSRDTDSE
jgi:AbrB family looped-hinge helix DNA binding protein